MQQLRSGAGAVGTQAARALPFRPSLSPVPLHKTALSVKQTGAWCTGLSPLFCRRSLGQAWVACSWWGRQQGDQQPNNRAGTFVLESVNIMLKPRAPLYPQTSCPMVLPIHFSGGGRLRKTCGIQVRQWQCVLGSGQGCVHTLVPSELHV